MLQQYALDALSGAVSLTISNSTPSIPRFAVNVVRMKAEWTPQHKPRLTATKQRKRPIPPNIRLRSEPGNETYLCRIRPWPKELEDAFRNMGTEIFETMFGPSDFRIVGTIRDWMCSSGWARSQYRPCSSRADSTNVHRTTCEKCTVGLRARGLSCSSRPLICRSSRSHSGSTGVMRDFLRQHDT